MADITKVNDILLSNYNASLLSYSSGTLTIYNNYFKPDNRLNPVIFASQMPLRILSLKLEFVGATDAEAEINASALVAVFSKETELFLPDGFFYKCILSSTKEPTRITKGIFQREVYLVGYRHGNLESVVIPADGVVNIKGNYKTGVRISIIPNDTTVTVNDITISNVVGASIVVDGIDCFVLEDGQNKFVDTEMTQFPSLDVGAQTISVSGASSATLEYYPIYY